MRFCNAPALGTGVLLCVSLASCTQSSSGPLPEAAGIPASAATSAVPAVHAAAAPKPLSAVECPAGSKPVADAWNGPDRVCHGPIPAYFAQVMARIPMPPISPERMQAWAAEEQDFTVIPGRGQRPDILVKRHGSLIRSFEGADPATTIYLSNGFDCTAPDDTELGCGAFADLRAYVSGPDGLPKDVTTQVLPPSPLPAPVDGQRYLTEHGATAMYRDDSRLGLVPVMRAFVELDPDRPLPPSDPRSFGYVHLGFLVWNGVRFELRDQVPRSLWPCEPVWPDKPACANDQGDRFVTRDR